MKLTKYQKEALGFNQSLPEFVWNHRMASIYKSIDNKNLQISDGQTFNEFIQMEKQQPNEQGTGRYKFNRIRKIQYFFIKNQHSANPSAQSLQTLDKFIQTFLRRPVQHRKQLKMTISNNNIIDKGKNIIYTIKQIQNRLDVYDLLDLLMQYTEESTILVAFVQKQLQEEGDLLDGRACGDGVAVISYEYQDFTQNIHSLLQTTIHETLHTLGFDHCVAWKCLMNAFTNFQSWLCPACSRKLYHELKLNNEASVKQWISSVASLLSLKDKKKGHQLISSFNSI